MMPILACLTSFLLAYACCCSVDLLGRESSAPATVNIHPAQSVVRVRVAARPTMKPPVRPRPRNGFSNF